MTVSEFGFLAMGLVLGIATGAALIEILRARPPVPREVRLTVAPDAVPRRRARTLAGDAFGEPSLTPARGGPAELLPDADESKPSRRHTRTPVRSAPTPGRVLDPVFRLIDPSARGDPAARVAMSVDGGLDPMLAALRASASIATSVASAVASGGPVLATATANAGRAMATAARSVAAAGGERWQMSANDARSSNGRGGARPGARPATRSGDTPRPDRGDLASLSESVSAERDADTSGPCADERRIAEERCELATRARALATNAEDTLRTAQRAYDDHESRADEAARTADPRSVRQAKDEAQGRFRAGRGGATTTEQVEAAARAWLTEINQINTDAREAGAIMVREREAAQAIGATLERTSLEADAARIAAEAAEAACLQARQAVADCEERDAAAEAGGRSPALPVSAPLATPDPDRGLPVGADMTDEGRGDEPLVAALGAGATPRIFRLLRGDRAALIALVDALAGDDAMDRRRWQTGIADLVDAILADGIEASALDFPTDHPFWGPFTRSQARDITSALSSLGYRFDGFGGWVDERFPSQRDLSLALGYAGLDPMRMRHWPDEREMTGLFEDVTVAADEHLATNAGDLTLGELVTMLGRRADGLTEVWNGWGRLRPLLLEEA